MRIEIIKIAERVRKELIEIYDSPKAVCLEASRMLKKELEQYGAIIIQGRFKIDEPDMENYDLDFDLEEDNEIVVEPLHYWIEVEGEILDITADQFQDEVLYDELEEITYGTYEELTRYIKDKEDWN